MVGSVRLQQAQTDPRTPAPEPGRVEAGADGGGGALDGVDRPLEREVDAHHDVVDDLPVPGLGPGQAERPVALDEPGGDGQGDDGGQDRQRDVAPLAADAHPPIPHGCPRGPGRARVRPGPGDSVGSAPTGGALMTTMLIVDDELDMRMLVRLVIEMANDG